MKHPKRFAWAAFVLLLGLVAFAIAQTPVPVTEGVAYSESESARALMLTPGKIFTFFFVMLGPLKILGPFVRSTYGMRSEEHTSELQSQSNLVCRLLLEKKKKKT